MKNKKRRNRYLKWLEKRNKKKMKKKSCKNKKRKYKPKELLYPLKMPRIVSMLENDDETINYFNSIIKTVNKKIPSIYKAILIDAKEIESITIDSLMYLLAIIKSLKGVKGNINEFRGNLPLEESAKTMFKESGFLNYVENNVALENITVKNKLQILTGIDVDGESVKKLIDFIEINFKIERTKIKFLYNMIIELMTNTNNHAYENSIMQNKWYLYAYVNDEKSKIYITFVDTGIGIPYTVLKKWNDNVKKIVYNKGESFYIASTMDGDFRTKTNLPYRGKGLPDIYLHLKNDEIHNLKIISGRGKLDFSKTKNIYDACVNIKNELQGTVYYFELEKERNENV